MMRIGIWPSPALLSAAVVSWFIGLAGNTLAAAPDMDAIASYVESAMRQDRFPGAAVAVIVGGQVALSRGFGRDGEGRPVTPHTGFRLGSMSKAFTALAVMRAVDAGLLSLDMPVQANLPEFTLADHDAAARITLRQLLAHTSGLPRTARRAAPDATLATHVAVLASVTPSAGPGERHEYSSANYLVAARMLEVVEGRLFSESLRSEVLIPLGMMSSLVTADDDHEGIFTRGHRYWMGFPFPANLSEERGRLATAGLISSAKDMAQFLQFQLGDGTWKGIRLLSSETMIEMHRGTAPSDGFRYAMGWREGQIAGQRALHHGGILPDFRGKMVLLPELDAAVVVLTNASSLIPLPALPTSHRLADEIAGYLAGEPLSPTTFSFGSAILVLWLGLGLIFLAEAGRLLRKVRSAQHAPPGLISLCSSFVMLGGLAFGLPFLTGLAWSDVWSSTPDLLLWMVGTALLVLIRNGIDLVHVTRIRRNGPNALP